MKTIEDFINEYGCNKRSEIRDAMKSIVEYHVTEALKQASNIPLKNNRVLWDDPKEGEEAYMIIQTVDKESILKSYDLTLIK